MYSDNHCLTHTCCHISPTIIITVAYLHFFYWRMHISFKLLQTMSAFSESPWLLSNWTFYFCSTCAAGVSSSGRWVSPATARAATSTWLVVLLGESSRTVLILVNICSLSLKVKECYHHHLRQSEASQTPPYYLHPGIHLILVSLSVQHVRNWGENLSKSLTGEQTLLL